MTSLGTVTVGPAQSAITEEDWKFVEEWENIATPTNYVIKLDVRGDEVFEQISGRRKFYITTRERMLTESKIVDEKYNPFLNGQFRPITVPMTVNVKSNPNALSDEEIVSIFGASQLAWDGWMVAIDSPETLRRMVDLAEGTDISHKRFREIQARLETASPRKRLVQKDREQYEKMGGGDDGLGAPRAGRRRVGSTG